MIINAEWLDAMSKQHQRKVLLQTIQPLRAKMFLRQRILALLPKQQHLQI